MKDPIIGKKSTTTNTVYIPREMREEVEKISIELSYRLKRQINPSEFIQYLYRNYGEVAMDELMKVKED
ncbi:MULTISPECIES: hypothetical protein [unclassified Sodalis]|uniref:hypothetical protein n=1 Tax=Sodalis TaxID=84565 RepID=UPI000940357B|nr:hypothetical protein [Candidatus Sodalis sp. SoCistrobi]